jgi:hypothetical protein
LRLVRVGLQDSGGLPQRLGRELLGSGLSAEEVGDLPDRRTRRLDRAFLLEQRPDSAADLLFGAFDLREGLPWLCAQ